MQFTVLTVGNDHSLVIQPKLNRRRWNSIMLPVLLAMFPLLAHADFEILSGRSRATEGMVETRMTLSLDIGSDPAEALVKGIPLTINLNIVLVQGSKWPWHRKAAQWQYPYRIQYRALSNQYTLLRPQSPDVEAFPSLYETLDRIRLVLLREKIPDSVADADALAIRAQLELDRSSLPGPLRLTTVFFSSWQLNSDWHQWQVTR